MLTSLFKQNEEQNRVSLPKQKLKKSQNLVQGVPSSSLDFLLLSCKETVIPRHYLGRSLSIQYFKKISLSEYKLKLLGEKMQSCHVSELLTDKHESKKMTQQMKSEFEHQKDPCVGGEKNDVDGRESIHSSCDKIEAMTETRSKQ